MEKFLIVGPVYSLVDLSMVVKIMVKILIIVLDVTLIRLFRGLLHLVIQVLPV